jgi:hypothetical protein
MIIGGHRGPLEWRRIVFIKLKSKQEAESTSPATAVKKDKGRTILRQRQPSLPEMAHISLQLPRGVHTRLRMEALRQRRTLAAALIDLIETHTPPA